MEWIHSGNYMYLHITIDNRTVNFVTRCIGRDYLIVVVHAGQVSPALITSNLNQSLQLVVTTHVYVPHHLLHLTLQ